MRVLHLSANHVFLLVSNVLIALIASIVVTGITYTYQHVFRHAQLINGQFLKLTFVLKVALPAII